MSPSPTEIALVFAGGVVAIVSSAAVRRAARRWRARRRARRWRRGETRAEKLLASCGYRITERQVTHRFALKAGRDVHEATLRADFLAQRRGRTYVAEAKTGAQVGTLACTATRRQVLEYLIAYDVDGVLLVDVKAGNVTEVSLPAVPRPRGSQIVTTTAALFAGAAVTWLLLG